MGGGLDKKLRHVSFPGIEEMESLEDIYCVCRVVQKASGRKRLKPQHVQKSSRKQEEYNVRGMRSGKGDSTDEGIRTG